MASPFAVFRKNQKLWLASLGVMAILSFVFLPIVQQVMDSRSVRADVAATTKYEDISEAKLGYLSTVRVRLNMFMAAAIREAFNFPFNQDFFGPADEENIVNTLLLAHRAEEQGVVVTDDSIRNFLRAKLADRVSGERLQAITTAVHLNERQLFEGLRTELLALSVRELVYGAVVSRDPNGGLGVPPGERWDFYKRLNRRAKIEAIPVKVADLARDVADPDQATIAKFFEDHKNNYWLQNSPEPGFHRPTRVKFEYVKAEYEDFFKPDDISAEEIAAHYEANKDTRYLYSGTTTGEAEAEPDVPLPSDDAPATNESPPVEQPVSGDAVAPAGDAPAPPTEQPPAAETPTQQPPVEEPPAAEPPASPPAADQPPAEQPATDAPPGGGGDDAGAAPAEEAPPVVAESPAADTPATDAAVIASEQPGAEGKSSDDLMLPDDITKAPDPKYDPLWKVEDRIRRELATQKAGEKMQEPLRKLQAEMSSYSTARVTHDINQGGEAPVKPDLQQFATQNGLSAAQSDLISAEEALTTDNIARSSTASGDMFLRLMYEGNIQPYTPMMSEDLEGNQYLFWKLEETKEYIPKLADPDVRDEVIAAWKLVQARALARKRAEELSAKAKAEPGKTLRELYAPEGKEIIDAGPFSWLTYGSAEAFSPQTPPRINQVQGVENPGPEFMRAVFSLEPGQTGVGLNNPQLIAYVIRVATLEPSDQFLHATFMADNFQRYRLAGIEEVNDVRDRWTKLVETEAGLDWVRPARE